MAANLAGCRPEVSGGIHDTLLAASALVPINGVACVPTEAHFQVIQ